MSTKIKLELSHRSIQDAIKQIKQYKKRLLELNEKFIQRLLEKGIPVIDDKIGESNTRYPEHNTYIKLNRYQDYTQGRLVCEGKEILFIEFGAGVHYNGEAGSSPHERGQELGYTIGSYGKGHGKEDGWWYYADSGELTYTHGTIATMPVYNAGVKIRDEVIRTAKEVFG